MNTPQVPELPIKPLPPPEPVPIAKPELEQDLETLARACSQLAPTVLDGGKYLAKHRVASFLHGWDHHEYHQNTKVKLTLADYQKALEAIDTETTHAPAMRK